MSGPIDEVASYYSQKLAKHGQTPQGVDWNGKESQELRFTQLARIIEPGRPYSINDLGCGYGAMLDYLHGRPEPLEYCGIDVAAPMVAAAQERYRHIDHARFIISDMPDQDADYGVASGIFNIRQGHSDDEWRAHIERVLDTLNRTSRIAFSFNCLTSYSDADKMRGYLYYADPLRLFDFCKRNYSREVALLHDYGLFEFTILVRKSKERP